MSVKKITNRQIVSRGAVDRSSHRTFRDEVSRGGNRSKSIIPGKDFTENYSITLKDIDTTILSHIKEVIKQDPQREIVAPRTLTLVQIYAIIERVEEELNLKHQN